MKAAALLILAACGGSAPAASEPVANTCIGADCDESRRAARRRAAEASVSEADDPTVVLGPAWADELGARLDPSTPFLRFELGDDVNSKPH